MKVTGVGKQVEQRRGFSQQKRKEMEIAVEEIEAEWQTRVV